MMQLVALHLTKKDVDQVADESDEDDVTICNLTKALQLTEVFTNTTILGIQSKKRGSQSASRAMKEYIDLPFEEKENGRMMKEAWEDSQNGVLPSNRAIIRAKKGKDQIR